MEITIEEITPAKATEYLLHNHGNRTLRPRKVAQYADQMTRGQWVFTAETIQFSENGRLMNGQHRLSAVVQSGVTITQAVARGVPDEAFKVMDAGMPRGVGDALGYEIVDRNVKSAVCRVLYIVEKRGDPRFSIPRAAVTRTDVSNYYMEHHAEIDAAIPVARPLYTSMHNRGNLTAWISFTVLAWRAVGETSDLVGQFLDGVREGANLGKGDARLALRNFLLNDNRPLPSAGHHLHILIKAWNDWLRGERRQVMASRADEAWPVMLNHRVTPNGTSVTEDMFRELQGAANG